MAALRTLRYLGLFLAVATSILGQEPAQTEALIRRFEDATGAEKLRIALALTDDGRRPPLPADELVAYSRQALALARQFGDRRDEAHALRNLANAEYEMRDFQSALDSFLRARALSAEIGDRALVAETNMEIGHLFHFCYSDFDTTRVYYTKALEGFREIGDLLGQARSLNNIGEAHKKSGKWEAAARSYLGALQASEGFTSDRGRAARATILANLGETFTLLEDYSTARDYLDQAMEIYKRESRQIEIARTISRAGDIDRQQQRYDQALAQYTKALELLQASYNEGYIADELQKLAETHALAGDSASSLRYFDQALAVRSRDRDQLATCRTLLAKGKAEQSFSHSAKARRTLLEALQLAEKNDFLQQRHELYGKLSTVSGALGASAEELSFRKRHDALGEQLALPRMHANVAKILARYESEKTMAELRQTRAQGNRIALVAAVALAATLALAALLWFNLRRLRRWASRLLSSKNLELAEQQSQLETLKQRLRELEQPPQPSKYSSSRLSKQQAQECLSRLLAVMEEERAFLDSELTLDGLAQRLGINRTYLSQAINEQLGKSFNEFLGQLRVEEATRVLVGAGSCEPSILDVGYAVGFNSKSSYYKAFKKHTGLTPVEFRSRARAER